MKRFILLLLFFTGLIHAQTDSFVDNTNSEGLSSMQRAILKEDISRMEGLIKNGAGYYWCDNTGSSPLINYAISNNKPKAVDFLLSKQTVVGFSSIDIAMEQSSYTLVKKLIDQDHLRVFRDTNIIMEIREATGQYSNITEITPYEEHLTNWQIMYTLTNKKTVLKEYTLEVGTNLYNNTEEYILQHMKNKKQKENLAKFSSNISLIITNSISKTNVRREEIFRTRIETNKTNMLLSVMLDKEDLSDLAQIAVKQNSLPMLQYFIDKGANPSTNYLLHYTVALRSKEMLVYLLRMGVNPLQRGYVSLPYSEYEPSSYEGTPFNIAERMLENIKERTSRKQENAKYLREQITFNEQNLVAIRKQDPKLIRGLKIEYEGMVTLLRGVVQFQKNARTYGVDAGTPATIPSFENYLKNTLKGREEEIENSLKQLHTDLAEVNEIITQYIDSLQNIQEIYDILKKYEE